MSPLPPIRPPQPPLPVRDAAARLGVSASFLNKARMSGDGPAYLKIGRRVLYRPTDLDAFAAAARRRQVREGGDV